MEYLKQITSSTYPIFRGWDGQVFNLNAWITYRKIPKRVLDMSLLLLAAPAVMSVIGIFWLLIKLDGGPGFYAQERIGKNGKKFNCWKLRSMRVDAEEYLQKYLSENEDAAAEWNERFKLANDPRITKIGHFIRKSSIDELPQLFNVFIGDMSLVGPRPFPPSELTRYGQSVRYYKRLKPGITGIWQTSGRNSVSYETRVEMDVEYFKNVSFKTDLTLIFKTFLAMVKKEGL